MWPEAVALIRDRRTIRQFRKDPLSKSDIRTILEAGTWAPSAHNAQPWRFAVVLSQEKKREMAVAMGAKWREDLRKDGITEEEIATLTGESEDSILSTPVVVVVCFDMADMDSYPDERRSTLERIMAIQSASACAQNILLTAQAMGFGGGWNCAPLFAQEEVKHSLRLDPGWQPVAMIALGSPAETPTPPSRKPVDEVSVWI